MRRIENGFKGWIEEKIRGFGLVGAMGVVIKQKNLKVRFFVLIGCVVVFSFACLMRLFDLQVINGLAYREKSELRLISPTPIRAPRGEILDRNGLILVTNKMGFTVKIQKIDITKYDLSLVILNLIKLFEQNNYSYIKSKLEIQSEGGNGDLERYRELYHIPSDFSWEEAWKVILVKHEMKARGFSLINPFTFADGAEMDIVQKIKEQYMDLPGVIVDIEPIRDYKNGSLAAHILGRVGNIYKEEYELLKRDGYGMNDIIGKDGLEKILESSVRGKNGLKSIETTKAGIVTRVLQSKSAVPGNYVTLTIDAELQKKAEESLQSTINRIRNNSKFDGGRGSDAYCGAVVVVNVKNGEILAMASCPSYDLSSFDYNTLLSDLHLPMFNRALSGTYPPGSTFKMSTAIAALESQAISVDTKIYDTGVYMRFARSGYTPKCWKKSGHGLVNVIDALCVSCNCFFYEAGWRATIEAMNNYSRLLGLGEATGIELNESVGILAGPDYTKNVLHSNWEPGMTVQAAIGQSYNMFTPAQLANYVATIVNGGTRYRLHLIKEIRSYDGELIKESGSEIMAKFEMKPENYKAIMDGMRRVVESGTASSIFRNFPIKVGGKTGTAEGLGTDNGVFVGFAPVDDPEIAVCVVVEHGVHGNSIAIIAREVFAKYFGVVGA